MVKQGMQVRLDELQVREEIRYSEHRNDNPYISADSGHEVFSHRLQTDTARMIESGTNEDEPSDSDLWSVNHSEIDKARASLNREGEREELKNEMGEELFNAVTEYVSETVSSIHGNHPSIAKAFLAN